MAAPPKKASIASAMAVISEQVAARVVNKEDLRDFSGEEDGPASKTLTIRGRPWWSVQKIMNSAKGVRRRQWAISGEEKFKVETSAKILPQLKSTLNKPIYCRAGALACKIQPWAAVPHDCREVSSSRFKVQD